MHAGAQEPGFPHPRNPGFVPKNTAAPKAQRKNSGFRIPEVRIFLDPLGDPEQILEGGV